MMRFYYEAISGPLRFLKSCLLASFALGCLLSIGAVVLGYPVVSLGVVCAFVSALLVLSVLLQLRASAKLNDLHYELSLHENLRAKRYRIEDLYFDGAAANPSLMLLLWKCLHMCRPQSVLELGSGQTTKLLGLYYRDNPAVEILTLEHDGRWVETLRQAITHDGRCHDYHHAPLQPASFFSLGARTQIETAWYDFDGKLVGRTFGLILVDGPNGSNQYSRGGVLEWVPQILADPFIVIFDDAERYGEIMTIKAFEKTLEANNVPYVSFDVNGVTRQYVFCSPVFSFLRFT